MSIVAAESKLSGIRKKYKNCSTLVVLYLRNRLVTIATHLSAVA